MDPLRIFPNAATLATAVADHIAGLVCTAVDERAVFHWAVAGGQTPALLYRTLATPAYAHLPWNQVHIWFGDERTVPHDHLSSNFRMVRETLLDHVPILDRHIHPMPTEMRTLRQGAWAYAQSLEALLLRHQGVPCLDLVLLGMGADGHVASLFPGSCALHQTHQAAVANYAPGPQAWRITLTKPILDHARHVLLLVAGSDKATAVAQTLGSVSGSVSGSAVPSGRRLPVQQLAPCGSLTWYLDVAAASLLDTALDTATNPHDSIPP